MYQSMKSREFGTQKVAESAVNTASFRRKKHQNFTTYAKPKRASSSGNLPAARHSTGSESAGGRSGGKGSC